MSPIYPLCPPPPINPMRYFVAFLNIRKLGSKTLNNFFEVAQLVNSEAPPKTCSASYSTK